MEHLVLYLHVVRKFEIFLVLFWRKNYFKYFLKTNHLVFSLLWIIQEFSTTPFLVQLHVLPIQHWLKSPLRFHLEEQIPSALSDTLPFYSCDCCDL